MRTYKTHTYCSKCDKWHKRIEKFSKNLSEKEVFLMKNPTRCPDCGYRMRCSRRGRADKKIGIKRI
jgi:predicted Zn-ribbon and HTH transcriptional regulator